MEILHRGVPPEDRNWIGTCHYCKSQLKAKARELRITSCQREGDFGQATCPVCKRDVNFYLEKP